ncbi:hypothetical protein HJD18_15830 [Thermoleophilia bacterium SCSIO 60948]|nr:hypothetical protein HJD18_15830 [Thermoleophilia bacterium SCSIO 60948]
MGESFETEAQARALRRRGRSLRSIGSDLGVSASTVLRWTSDIVLTPAQAEANLRRPQTAGSIDRRAASRSDGARLARSRMQETGRVRARARDPLHLAGCMLYWGEGWKSRKQLQLVNSDVALVRLFLAFLRVEFAVPDDDVRLRVRAHLGNGLSLDEVERHWLVALRLPAACLRGSRVDELPASSQRRRPRRLPLGVCELSVARSTDLVQHVLGAIQEYGGFTEPRWLG